MNISTRGRYGLRAVLDLAVNYSERPVTLSAIAARQQLSEGYLEQLMVPMKKAGISSAWESCIPTIAGKELAGS